MMYGVMEYLFIFMVGAMAGWVLEFFYRRYFGKARKWINPGFLSGPYLPLYGTGVTLLYMVSDTALPLWGKVVAFALVTTGIEYVTGLFFLKYYNTRLWDYTTLPLNVQGLIAPLYSFFWTVLSLFYYYVIYPRLGVPIRFIYDHLEYSLFIGFFYGIFILDAAMSFNVLNRLQAIAKSMDETKLVIQYDQLKWDIAERFDDLQDKVEDWGERLEDISERVTAFKPKLRRPTFLRPFSGDYNMSRHLQEHFKTLKKR